MISKSLLNFRKFGSRQVTFKEKILNGPGLGDFIHESREVPFDAPSILSPQVLAHFN
jgi:hypothetical protein